MILPVITSIVLVTACASAADRPHAANTVQIDEELDRIRASVEKVLPAGVRLLAVQRQGESIVLDLSEELLVVAHQGELEDTLHRLMAAASSARTSRPRVEDYRILIDGVPLEKRIP